MPDLGKYAFAVLGSYAASLALIALVVALSIWQARRMKQALNRAEARVTRGE
ncbi:heme exporter protein CcmD [Neogemmobacter tilapiae]|uniref:Heme exporter protein D n=1 Tax=Neogemmobacter tilapiae TaxID=875041 RepID=A0A918TF84_9RHOB|nr:heme exporter protein CcmD [Gemmobacter tilapiae]GHC46620.1 hypothetical protein GCM10007315_05460 [Gemmobacter tilapiae]